MAHAAETKRMGGEESNAINAFTVHDRQASRRIAGQAQEILTTHLGNEAQRKQTLGTIVASAVAIIEPRRLLHKVAQWLVQIAQPNVMRLDHVRIGVDNLL